MLFLCVLLVGGSPIANVMIENYKLNHSSNVNYRDTDIARILSVLENRLGSPTVNEKVKDKVSTLSETQIRLIASLAELTSNGGQTAGADIAFFLITILIILQ